MMVLFVLCLGVLCAVGALCMFNIFLIKVTEWPPIGKIAAHSAYDMFHGMSTWLLVWFFPPRFLEWESLSDCAFS